MLPKRLTQNAALKCQSDVSSYLRRSHETAAMHKERRHCKVTAWEPSLFTSRSATSAAPAANQTQPNALINTILGKCGLTTRLQQSQLHVLWLAKYRPEQSLLLRFVGITVFYSANLDYEEATYAI